MSRMRRPRTITTIRTAGVICGLVLFATSSGCALSGAQIDAVRKFSSATTAVGDAAGAELVRMRNETIAMNEVRLTVDPASEPDHTNLDESFDVDDVEARVKAAAVLKTYGQLLLSLATEQQGDEIQGASDKFASSVGALAPADRTLTDEQTQAMGQAVAEVGGWIVEYQKRRAVERVVKDSGEQVRQLAKLLADDFDPAGGRLATGYLTTISELQVSAHMVLADNLEPGPERDRAMSAYRLATENVTRLNAVSAQVARAIRQLSKAQSSLEKAVDTRKPSTDQIRAFATEAQTLYQALKVLGD